MSDDIKTNEGRVVGSWNGESAQELLRELTRIRQVLASERGSEKILPRDMPHRDQLHEDPSQTRPLPCVASGVVGWSASV